MVTIFTSFICLLIPFHRMLHIDYSYVCINVKIENILENKTWYFLNFWKNYGKWSICSNASFSIVLSKPTFPKICQYVFLSGNGLRQAWLYPQSDSNCLNVFLIWTECKHLKKIYFKMRCKFWCIGAPVFRVLVEMESRLQQHYWIISLVLIMSDVCLVWMTYHAWCIYILYHTRNSDFLH